MKQIEYTMVTAQKFGLHDLTKAFEDLGAEGWQAFHVHETTMNGEPHFVVHASRKKATGNLVTENDSLKRKLVAAYVLAAQHGVDYRSINESAEVIEIGHHACPTSPIGVCAYDGDDDPSNDDCLFCHDPDERK